MTYQSHLYITREREMTFCWKVSYLCLSLEQVTLGHFTLHFGKKKHKILGTSLVLVVYILWYLVNSRDEVDLIDGFL